MSNHRALLLLSGGIDSVQALYARCAAGQQTRTHYVRLLNWEGRAGAESAAVRRVLDWIEAKFPGLVEHTQSVFDYGDLCYIVRDHNIWGLKAGIILANPKNDGITEVVRTFHRDSVKGGINSAAGQAAERGWREPIERLTAKREAPVEFTYPQINMTKADIMSALPEDLLRLCWYCRRPRSGKPCHECHTCKQVDAVLAGAPLPALDGSADIPAETVVEPPKKNASRKDWAAFAEALNFDTDGLTKAQIIDLVG